MPARSIRQIAHLKRLNSLEQTRANYFKPGRKAWNKKYYDFPRNKFGQPLSLCPNCKEKLKSINFARCKACAYIARRGNGRRVRVTGYVYEERGSFPRPEHIVKAEGVLGRPLKKPECVHHVNMVRSDNRNTNLLICTRKYHAWLHSEYGRIFATEHFGGGVPFQPNL